MATTATTADPARLLAVIRHASNLGAGCSCPFTVVAIAERER